MPAPLDPPVATTTLGNGLRVTTVALPHLHTATVSAFIKVGSRFEGPADNGLSHFVEHMLFRGTERYPTSLALNTAVERLGSTLHAETGRDYTLLSMGFEPGTKLILMKIALSARWFIEEEKKDGKTSKRRHPEAEGGTLA